MLGFLGKLMLGNGTLRPERKAALTSEGLVLIEEELRGSVRYTHFKAPGKRFHGKVTPERMALGISRERFVIYCRSGRVKLIDAPLDEQRLSALDVTLEGDERVVIRVDYDRLGEPGVSGQIAIHLKTPNAARIVEQLRLSLGR